MKPMTIPNRFVWYRKHYGIEIKLLDIHHAEELGNDDDDDEESEGGGEEEGEAKSDESMTKG